MSAASQTSFCRCSRRSRPARTRRSRAPKTSGERRAGSTRAHGPASALTTWVDGEHVRRVRFAETAASEPPRGQAKLTVTKERTIDLWDYGVSLEDVDWTRLPDFRAPSWLRSPAADERAVTRARVGGTGQEPVLGDVDDLGVPEEVVAGGVLLATT